MAQATEHVPLLKDHWWWRPGWKPGRHFYACHFTVGGLPQIRRLADSYQEALADIPGLDLIPAQWLHLTMQGLGFVDELDRAQVEDLSAALAEALRAIDPPTVTFSEAVVRPEAVYLPAQPTGGIEAVRTATRKVIAATLGPDARLDETAGYRPHVSVAYSNRDQDAAPVVAALSRVHPTPTTATLRRVGLLTFHRDNRMYEWTTAQLIEIGQP